MEFLMDPSIWAEFAHACRSRGVLGIDNFGLHRDSC